jgi:hypothetical protein
MEILHQYQEVFPELPMAALVELAIIQQLQIALLLLEEDQRAALLL